MLDTGMSLASYPTDSHRDVARSLSDLNNKAYSFDGEVSDPSQVLESEEYRSLQATTEYVYSTRMSTASGFLLVAVNVAIVVAVYRYLRRNRVTTTPVAATVWINLLATLMLIAPSVYVSQIITGVEISRDLWIVTLVSAPFIIAFSVLLIYFVARLAQWQYNKRYGVSDE